LARHVERLCLRLRGRSNHLRISWSSEWNGHVGGPHSRWHGNGYWILFADGVVASFGDAQFYGDPLGVTSSSDPATAIFTSADGGGYWVASADGTVYSYGDAPNDGGEVGIHLNGAIIAATGW
jgi:hypothetical protein